MSIYNERILEEIKRTREEIKSSVEAVEVRLSMKSEDLRRKIQRLVGITLEFVEEELGKLVGINVTGGDINNFYHLEKSEKGTM